MKDGHEQLDRFLPLLLVGVAWCSTGLYFDRGLDAFDAGLFAAEAERVASGGVYGRDFLAPYGPGRYYLIAVLFSLFGFTLKVQAWFWLLLRGGVACLAYLIGRRFMSRSLAVLPVLVIILAPGALHKSLFQLTALLNVYVYLRYRDQPSAKRAFLAGATVGVGSLFRVDVGVFGFLSFLMLLWLELLWKKPAGTLLKRSAAFVGGAMLITAPVIVYFLAQADVPAILQAEWHRTANVSGFADRLDVPGVSLALSAPWPTSLKLFLLGFLIRAVPLTYLVLALAVAVSRFRKSESSLGLAALGLVVFGVPLLNQVRITPTFNHLLHAAPLALIAWTVFIAWFAKRPFIGKPGRTVLMALLVLSLGLPVFYNFAFTRGVFPGSIKNRFEYTEPILLDRAGIYETPEKAGQLERIVRYVESTTKASDTLYCGPFSPVIHFLSRRRPAVRYLEPFYYFRSDEQQRLMIQDLERAAPPLIILESAISVGGQTLERDASRLYSFIRHNYLRTGVTGAREERYQLWIKRR